MVLRTAAARRLLVLIGIVAMVFTPSLGDALPHRDPSEAVFARTLAPGEHPGLAKRGVSITSGHTWAGRVPYGQPVLLAALAALLLVLHRTWCHRAASPNPSPGPVLLRAPIRSPPIVSA